MTLLRYMIKASVMALGAACLALIPACDKLHEDLKPCPSGLSLRFVYDYNMEFANAFPAQVDCLTLLIYDASGRYLDTHIAARPLIAEENWRMKLDLMPGDYRLLAYGGMSCDDSSFEFEPAPDLTDIAGLEVRMNPEFLSVDVDKPLHHLFYGALDVTVPPPGTDTSYVEETVYMIKDTNDIRIILANENGIPVNEDDFRFNIIDNNTLLNSRNFPVLTAPATYYPWAKGNLQAGVLPGGNVAQVAFAEFATSRLMADNDALLTVVRVSDDKEVIKVPLINLLLLLKSERFNYMPPQEFLDRESRWNITFFLSGQGEWLKASIVINDWVVRINNIDQ